MQVGILGYSPLAQDAARRWLAAGFDVVVWDKDPAQAARFPLEDPVGPVARLASSIRELVSLLEPLRRLFIFSDPNESETQVLALAALLDVSDIVVDASDCSHQAADRRMAVLAQPRARYVGLAVLPKEPGSLAHASLLSSGHRVGSEAVASLLDALVPKNQMAYLGSGGAAQLLKPMLLAQLGAECQALSEILRIGQAAGLGKEELEKALPGWSQQAVETPLLQASAEWLGAGEHGAGAEEDAAALIGGAWRTMAHVMVDTDSAVPSLLSSFATTSMQVSARDREVNVSRYPRPARTDLSLPEKSALLEEMRQGFGAVRMVSTLQLIQVVRRVSLVLDYEISLLDCVRIIRHSALSRSALYDPFLTALADPNGTNLFAYPRVQFVLSPMIPSLRKLVGYSFAMGIPSSQCAANLCYFDASTCASPSGPSGAALLTALRDSPVPEPVAGRPERRK